MAKELIRYKIKKGPYCDYGCVETQRQLENRIKEFEELHGKAEIETKVEEKMYNGNLK